MSDITQSGSKVSDLLAAANALSADEQAELVRKLNQQVHARLAGNRAIGRATTPEGVTAESRPLTPLVSIPGPTRHPGPVHPAQYEGLTYRIIGCAMHIHNRLGSGHREAIYQAAMEEELQLAGLPTIAQRTYSVYDTPLGGHLLGFYIADLVVDNLVVVELKARSLLDRQHISQVIAYLKVSGCPIGLLINFGERRLNFRRILPPKNFDSYGVEHQWLYKPTALPAPGTDDRDPIDESAPPSTDGPAGNGIN